MAITVLYQMTFNLLTTLYDVNKYANNTNSVKLFFYLPNMTGFAVEFSKMSRSSFNGQVCWNHNGFMNQGSYRSAVYFRVVGKNYHMLGRGLPAPPMPVDMSAVMWIEGTMLSATRLAGFAQALEFHMAVVQRIC